MAAHRYVMKYIMVGDSGVGKSCLLLQFTDKRFQPLHVPTIAADFGSTSLTIDGTPVKLQIWDTAGEEMFKSVTRSYYRAAAGAFLVYDITRRETFDHLASWLQDVREYSSRHLEIMLIGNKRDLESNRVVSTKEATDFAKQNNLLYIETSACNSYNVDNAFIKTTEKLVQKIQNGIIDLSTEVSGIKVGVGCLTGSSSRTYSSIIERKSKSCCSL